MFIAKNLTIYNKKLGTIKIFRDCFCESVEFPIYKTPGYICACEDVSHQDTPGIVGEGQAPTTIV